MPQKEEKFFYANGEGAVDRKQMFQEISLGLQEPRQSDKHKED